VEALFLHAADSAYKAEKSFQENVQVSISITAKTSLWLIAQHHWHPLSAYNEIYNQDTALTRTQASRQQWASC